MRIALVSPYSWSYPGGVNCHVEALAEGLADRGHELRVLAPFDPPDRLSRRLHRAAPESREPPDYLVPLTRTVGLGFNGAISNVCLLPEGVTKMRRELRAFAPDVVHVHEPIVPLLSADAVSFRGAPVVGTFHTYSTKPVPNGFANLLGARRKFNQLHTRIAVSEAAAWTGMRWFGGEYVIIPNGVDTDAPPAEPAPPADELRIAFIGRADERKGLPVLLRAFEALIEHVPARLVVVGAEPGEVYRHLTDPAAESRIDARGRVWDGDLWRVLHESDLLCAPSLAGESFGMVLTEAFAAGTPVLASNIAGYSDVVSDGVDGVLIPPGDPQRLAEELQRLHHEPERLAEMGRAARQSAARYAWPSVAARVERVYERAQEAPSPKTHLEAAGRRIGALPASGAPRRPPARLPSFDPAPARAAKRSRRVARRVGVAVASVGGIGLAALAANRIGFDSVLASIVEASSTWVLVATGLMMLSLFARAAAWYWIAGAALPNRSIRRRDITSATMIGVLMSATLPARLGEPARATVMARRCGRMQETLPVLLGTLVSQTTLNVVALTVLGAIIVSSTDLFSSSSERLFLVSLAPAAILIAVLAAPAVVRRGACGGATRAARIVRQACDALLRVRRGLVVFRDPRRGPFAAAAQLGAWVIQVASVLALAVAMDLEGQMGVAGAAAVLFAVNVTAAIPVTPSNIGVFQLAVVTVLTTGFGVGAADALAFGVILQAVEIATSVALGLPALVREGLTWSDMRVRALGAAPARLSPHPRGRGGAETSA